MRVALVQGLFAANVLARIDEDKGSASKLSHLVVGRRPGFLATCVSSIWLPDMEVGIPQRE